MSGMWTWQSHKTKIGNGGTGEGQRQNNDPESKPFILKSKQIAKKNTKFTNYNYASTSLHFNQASNGFMVNIPISGRKSSQVTSYPGTFVVT